MSQTRIQLHEAALSTKVTAKFSNSQELGFYTELSRDFFGDNQFDFSKLEGGLLYNWKDKRRAIGMTFPAELYHYDVRERTNLDGTPIIGTHEERYSVGMELAWKETLSPQWNTQARLDLDRFTDNGPGYYDHWRVRPSGKLAWKQGKWGADLSVSYTHRDFDARYSQEPETETYWSSLLTISGKLAYKFNESLNLETRGEWKRSLANRPEEDYSDARIQIGVRYRPPAK